MRPNAVRLADCTLHAAPKHSERHSGLARDTLDSFICWRDNLFDRCVCVCVCVIHHYNAASVCRTYGRNKQIRPHTSSCSCDPGAARQGSLRAGSANLAGGGGAWTASKKEREKTNTHTKRGEGERRLNIVGAYLAAGVFITTMITTRYLS